MRKSEVMKNGSYYDRALEGNPEGKGGESRAEFNQKRLDKFVADELKKHLEVYSLAFREVYFADSPLQKDIDVIADGLSPFDYYARQLNNGEELYYDALGNVLNPYKGDEEQDEKDDNAAIQFLLGYERYHRAFNSEDIMGRMIRLFDEVHKFLMHLVPMNPQGTEKRNIIDLCVNNGWISAEAVQTIKQELNYQGHTVMPNLMIEIAKMMDFKNAVIKIFARESDKKNDLYDLGEQKEMINHIMTNVFEAFKEPQDMLDVEDRIFKFFESEGYITNENYDEMWNRQETLKRVDPLLRCTLNGMTPESVMQSQNVDARFVDPSRWESQSEVYPYERYQEYYNQSPVLVWDNVPYNMKYNSQMRDFDEEEWEKLWEAFSVKANPGDTVKYKTGIIPQEVKSHYIWNTRTFQRLEIPHTIDSNGYTSFRMPFEREWTCIDPNRRGYGFDMRTNQNLVQDTMSFKYQETQKAANNYPQYKLDRRNFDMTYIPTGTKSVIQFTDGATAIYIDGWKFSDANGNVPQEGLNRRPVAMTEDGYNNNQIMNVPTLEMIHYWMNQGIEIESINGIFYANIDESNDNLKLRMSDMTYVCGQFQTPIDPSQYQEFENYYGAVRDVQNKINEYQSAGTHYNASNKVTNALSRGVNHNVNNNSNSNGPRYVSTLTQGASNDFVLTTGTNTDDDFIDWSAFEDPNLGKSNVAVNGYPSPSLQNQGYTSAAPRYQGPSNAGYAPTPRYENNNYSNTQYNNNSYNGGGTAYDPFDVSGLPNGNVQRGNVVANTYQNRQSVANGYQNTGTYQTNRRTPEEQKMFNEMMNGAVYFTEPTRRTSGRGHSIADDGIYDRNANSNVQYVTIPSRSDEYYYGPSASTNNSVQMSASEMDSIIGSVLGF